MLAEGWTILTDKMLTIHEQNFDVCGIRDALDWFIEWKHSRTCLLKVSDENSFMNEIKWLNLHLKDSS